MSGRRSYGEHRGESRPGVQRPGGKPKSTGKRIGKSKPAKANNQLNRRVK